MGICMTATLYARLLYKMSLRDPSDYNESFVAQNVNADCLLVEQLLECLLLDMSCDLVSNFAPESKTRSPSHYSSVYRIIEDEYWWNEQICISIRSQFNEKIRINIWRMFK